MSSRSPLSFLSRCLVVVATLLLTPSARADTAEDTAQLLFDEAQKLMEQGKAREACPKLEKSLELDAAIGTRFSLAECYEKVGRVASAWRNYVAVADEARGLGQAEREEFSRARADAVRPRVPTVTLQVSEEVAALSGLEVTHDGEAVDRALWGAPMPLDPGKRRIRVSAPGHEPFEREVVLQANGSATVVEVKALQPSASGVATPAAAGPGDPPADPPADAEGGISTGLLATGIAVGGAGLIVTGIGVAMALSAKGSYDDAVAEHCVPAGCRPEGVTATEDARSQADLATVLFGVGLGAAAVGGTLTLIALLSGGDEPTEEVGLRLVPTAGGAMLGWGGAL